MRADRAFVLEAVQRNGLDLTSASPALQDDREVVLAAVAQAPWGVSTLSPALPGNRELVVAAVRADPTVTAAAPSRPQNLRSAPQKHPMPESACSRPSS